MHIYDSKGRQMIDENHRAKQVERMSDRIYRMCLHLSFRAWHTNQYPSPNVMR
jgi:hypothetical protein